MRIAVNARLLRPSHRDGIGWFIHETMTRICRQHTEHQFIFLSDHQLNHPLLSDPNVSMRYLLPPARRPFLINYWYRHSVRKALQKTKADFFFSPDGMLCLETELPQFSVIHDLNFEHRPQDMPKPYLKLYRNHFSQFAKKAKGIATVSEFSKNDLCRTYGIEASKVDVVYNGCREIFSPISKADKKATQKWLTQGHPYFICLGSLHPRKNIAGLLRAFAIYRDKYQGGASLVLVGNRQWWTKDMSAAVRALPHGKLIETGHLGDALLRKVLGSSELLVFPSFFEGFGIPVLEAFNAGIPVITSNVTALPEVAGDAALLINPNDHRELASGLHLLEKDDGLRTRLVAAGNRRKNLFSWDKTAALLWESIEKCIDA